MRALLIPRAGATVPAAAALSKAGSASVADVRRAGFLGIPAFAARHVGDDPVPVSQSGKAYGWDGAPAALVLSPGRWTAVEEPVEPSGGCARMVSVGARGRQGGQAGHVRVPRLWRADQGDRRAPFARATARIAG